ncbi:MAG: prolipoprotein diacylglyceryl transferase [Alphaproteobacteria bacterium]|nr:prolipoprotein diacylglyceryl transferase [Alphaproteobacteria bacterium]
MGPFHFPEIDPIALELGPIVIRWYALAYIAGLVFAWRYGMRIADHSPHLIKPDHIDQFLTWAIFGVILGGRFGHVFFYYPDYYLSNPIEIFKVWEGGMAFHGGLLGVIVAMLLFCRKNKLNPLWLGDVAAIVVPVGLFFGRIANFINQELWGRITDVSWAVIFPRAGPEPRHPSQLYEAGMEGILLFLLTFGAYKLFSARRYPGLLSGLFLIGYTLARAVGEIFREPEVLTTNLPFNTTYGQWLSVPMALIGVWFIWRAFSKPALKQEQDKTGKKTKKA